MKYVVLIIDGASGWPAAALGGRTSLEAAHTPNLDRLAREGTVGMVSNVPRGHGGFQRHRLHERHGLRPRALLRRPGPIEAAAMGIELEPGQVAMRCNLVTVLDGRMASYSAGNISSAESAELIAALQEGLGDERCDVLPRSELPAHPHRAGRRAAARHHLHPAARHRRAAGRRARSCGPGGGVRAGPHGALEGDLGGHPVNERRLARGKPPATQIWLFWPGMRPARDAGLRRALPAAEGGAHLAGGPAEGPGRADRHRLPADPGVTDGPDNDYEGQMKARPGGSCRPRCGLRARGVARRGRSRGRRRRQGGGHRAGRRADGAAQVPGGRAASGTQAAAPARRAFESSSCPTTRPRWRSRPTWPSRCPSSCGGRGSRPTAPAPIQKKRPGPRASPWRRATF